MNMHTMDVLDSSGHTTITWNPEDQASVAEARAQFDHYIRQGFQAFAMEVVHEDGVVVEDKTDRRVTQFDPQAGRVMMVPQLRGG